MLLCISKFFFKRVELTLSVLITKSRNKGTQKTLGDIGYIYDLACGVGIIVFACVQAHQIVYIYICAVLCISFTLQSGCEKEHYR